MYSEDDLRRRLGEGAPTHPGAINTALVIRRSGRRRHARQAIVGGATTLAVLGIGAGAIVGVRAVGGSTSSSSSVAVGESPTKPDTSSTGPKGATDGGERSPAEKLNLCGGALATVAPNADGLVLTVRFPDTAAAASMSITGTVTLTNTGTKRIIGTTSTAPAITLSQRGVTLWHSNGVTAYVVRNIDLAPGASIHYPASFSPVVCSVEDDASGSFRADLPRATPGDYSLSAAIDLSQTSSSGVFVLNDLISGPLAAINLR